MSAENKDRQILALLFRNSRVSLRDIGREVDLGASAVSARINRLMASGGLIRFATRVNPAAFGFPGLAFISFQEGQIGEEASRIVQRVGTPFAQGETVAGDTFLLKAVTIADGPMLSKLRGMPSQVEVSEVELKWSPVSMLSSTDLRIIRCLLSNPRARVDEIATCASVTAKTVSHRLECLQRERVLNFRIDLDASKSSLVEGYLFIKLGDGVRKVTLERIDQTLGRGMLYTSHLRFDREMVITYCCAETVFDLGPILKQIRLLEGVLEVEVHVFSRLKFFHDWISKAIDSMVEPLLAK